MWGTEGGVLLLSCVCGEEGTFCTELPLFPHPVNIKMVASIYKNFMVTPFLSQLKFYS